MAKYTFKQMEAELADQKGAKAGLSIARHKKSKHHAQISRFVKRHHKGA